MRDWLGEMISRAEFSLKTDGRYPCTLQSYPELLEHPQAGDAGYRKSVTNASVLYPTVALFAALLGDTQLFDKVAELKRSHLEHCNFQLWYPDDVSEEHLYTNSDLHGAALSDLDLQRGPTEFLNQVLAECTQSSPQLTGLSAFRLGHWPLIVVACRHYRLPIPVYFLKDLDKEEEQAEGKEAAILDLEGQV